VEQQQYKVDHQLIKQYYPLDVVVKGMLDIYQVPADIWSFVL
jgi:hypothetical protein